MLALQIDGIEGIAAALKKAAEATDRAAAAGANDAAFAGRKAMVQESLKNRANLRLVGILKATPTRMEAIIRDRGWTRNNITGRLHTTGQQVGTLSGDYATIPGGKEFRGAQKTMFGLGTGFVGQMRSGKLGVWMRQGRARTPINLLYSLRPGAYVDAVVDAGEKEAAIESVHSFTRSFAYILRELE